MFLFHVILFASIAAGLPIDNTSEPVSTKNIEQPSNSTASFVPVSLSIQSTSATSDTTEYTAAPFLDAQRIKTPKETAAGLGKLLSKTPHRCSSDSEDPGHMMHHSKRESAVRKFLNWLKKMFSKKPHRCSIDAAGLDGMMHQTRRGGEALPRCSTTAQNVFTAPSREEKRKPKVISLK